jgi:hypothetical protein
VKRKDKIFVYDHLNREAVCQVDAQNFVGDNSRYFSELMIVDVENEGLLDAFSEELILPFVGFGLQLICFGGITSSCQINSLFSTTDVSAVAVANSLSYREIPHKLIMPETQVDIARQTSFGDVTRGAKEW